MWGLVALRLSDEEILPFNYSNYVTELEVTCPSELSNKLWITCFRIARFLFFNENSKFRES